MSASWKGSRALRPVCNALRYSATHRNPYNVVYRLTPYEAYRQRLVKRIEVASVVKEDDTAHSRQVDAHLRPGWLWQDHAVHRSSFQFLGLPACPGLKTDPVPTAPIV